MNRPLQLLVIVLFFGLVTAEVFRRSSADKAPAVPEETAPNAGEALSDVAQPSQNREEANPEISKLEKMARARQLRDEAAKKTDGARSALLMNRQPAWRKAVEDRRRLFEELRRNAKQSPNKQVPCTICDTKGILDFCVICDHSGKCPDCKGIGKNEAWVCPTCQGTGNCFYCNGLKKMPCPFCQSHSYKREVITTETPDPPNEIPFR